MGSFEFTGRTEQVRKTIEIPNEIEVTVHNGIVTLAWDDYETDVFIGASFHPSNAEFLKGAPVRFRDVTFAFESGIKVNVKNWVTNHDDIPNWLENLEASANK